MASPARKRLPTREFPNPSTTSSSQRLGFAVEPSNFFPSSKADFLRLVAVVAIAASVAVTCNVAISLYNRQPKPFCDSISEFDDSLSDYCEPCPHNGVCYEGKLECAHGYRKHGKICMEDGNINEAAKKLSEFLEVHACEAYAQFLCSGDGIVWAQQDKLWNNLNEPKLMSDYGLDEAAYVLAKEKATRGISKLLETRISSHGIREIKCPDLLVEGYKPISCLIRRWIFEHALVLVPVFPLLLGCSMLFLRVLRKRNLSVRAEQIYSEVCDVLEENALISRGVRGEGEPWVVASWLRDHLLSPKERKDPLLWKKVEMLVQEDSRLARYPKIVKGEPKVVWEWQVEGPFSFSGKRKRRMESKPEMNENMNLLSNQQSRAVKAGESLNC